MKILSILLAAVLLFPTGQIKKPVKYIALTFDDGPHPEYTPQILKILYENGAAATFFVVGENAERYPELVRAEFDLGFEIGNHTFSHLRTNEKSAGALYDEIKKADGIISEITGEKPTLFRPPEGRHNNKTDEIIKKAGKKTVLWTIDTRDWAHTDKYKIIENIKNNVNNGSVILFHDYIVPPSPTPDVLREILPYLKERGYEFVTVTELLRHKADIGGVSSFFIG